MVTSIPGVSTVLFGFLSLLHEVRLLTIFCHEFATSSSHQSTPLEVCLQKVFEYCWSIVKYNHIKATVIKVVLLCFWILYKFNHFFFYIKTIFLSGRQQSKWHLDCCTWSNFFLNIVFNFLQQWIGLTFWSRNFLSITLRAR